MENILTANQASLLVQGIVSKGTQDLSYKVDDPFPNLAKYEQELLPTGSSSLTNPLSSQASSLININRENFLHQLLIKTVLTFDTEAHMRTFRNSKLGKTLYSRIAIRSNAKVLAEWQEGALIAQAKDLDSSKCVLWDSVTMPRLVAGNFMADATTTGVTSCVVYTPVPWSMFDVVQCNIETLKLEQMTLELQFNNAAGSGIGTASYVSSAAPTLLCYRWRPDPDHYKAIMAKNLDNPSGYLSILATDTYVERMMLGQSGNTVGTFSYRCMSNYVDYKTHFFIKSTTTAFDSTSGDVSLELLGTFGFNMAGSELFGSSNMPVVAHNYDAGHFNFKLGMTNTFTTYAKPMTDMVTINWGLVGNDRTFSSGMASYTQLNNPTITLNFAGVQDNTHELFVVHEYFTLISRDATGIIAKQVST